MADLLIIDDDTLAADRLARLLTRAGHETRHAPDVGAALRCLSQRHPDLVLLDINLPRTDGLTLLDALRGEPRFAHTRVAVYTGRDEPDARDTARRLGACEFILKGLPWAVTYRQIQQCLISTDEPPPPARG
jgi:DNA-binding response OmpR family regulator